MSKQFQNMCLEQACPTGTKVARIDWHIQAQLGMDQKMLLGHIGGHSDQPIFTGDPRTPRGGPFPSGDPYMCPIDPGFFFYVKTIYCQHFLTSQPIKYIREFIEEMQFNIQIPLVQSISKVHRSMKEQCFHTKTNEKLFKIYDFHIEKKSQPDFIHWVSCRY